MRLGIRKVKTFHGLKYGVVDLDAKPLILKDLKKPSFWAKDIDVIETKTSIALFPLTNEGLQQARDLRVKLSK